MDLDFNNPEYFTHVLSVNGKLLEVLLRRGRSDSAFIDYLTFTLGKSTFHETMRSSFRFCSIDEDEAYIAFISQTMESIFGFGITEKCKGKGKFFYNGYYCLGPKKAKYGTVHIGGQRGTILVDLSATGCQAALQGWEQRLHEFAKTADRFVISRVDAACDFFNGEYTVKKALRHYKAGKFNVKGMRPKYKLEGTDWFNRDNTGKTLYIGRRGSSKFCRVYEKGKQLGDPESLWVRFEIEFRKNDCLIPLDILLHPGQYLGGAYPICKELFRYSAKRIHASERKAQTTLQEKILYGRNQVGKLVRYLADDGWQAEEIVSALIAASGQYPDGLQPMEYDCTAENVEYVHHRPQTNRETCEQLLTRCRQMLVQSSLYDDDVLQEFDEDVEFWRWFETTIAAAENPKAAHRQLQKLFNGIFNKYIKIDY